MIETPEVEISNLSFHDRSAGCLLGLACGDAVGTTVEFSRRGSFEKVTDMVGGGPFRLKPGQWTDDTSMALCLAASLVDQGGFDAADQMTRYCRWYEDGYMSSNGTAFDIGETVRKALTKFRRTGEPFSGSTDEYSAGNGSIMRLAPIPLKYFADLDKSVQFAAESSRTTHGAQEAVDACKLLSLIIHRALDGQSKKSILSSKGIDFDLSPKIREIADGFYLNKDQEEIEGNGYVVESLEAALWCFNKGACFESAVLTAVNLGNDADTTAAICGQVAGAFWGKCGMPEDWLAKLVMRSEIEDFARTLVGDGADHNIDPRSKHGRRSQ